MVGYSPQEFSVPHILSYLTCKIKLLICCDNKHADNCENFSVVNKKNVLCKLPTFDSNPHYNRKCSNFAVIMISLLFTQKRTKPNLPIMQKIT
jgi:hypothetical protein